MRRFALIFFIASVAVLAGAPEVMAGQEALYKQVVDNEVEGRFEADDTWGTSSYGRGVKENNYRFARPVRDAADAPTNAQFSVEIPEAGNYAVYARWPNVKGGNDAAQVGVETASGTQWTQVNQQRDGGKWVKLGVFEMRAGDDYSVFFSRQTDGEGYVIADAVKAEWDSPVAEAPETKEAVTESSESNGARVSESRAPEGRSGQDVIRESRKWIGTPYRLGGQTRRGVDCSGLTMQVFKRFGVSMPHWDDKQYRMGTRVPKGQEQPGDLVFFNEHGRGISHVGIYSGNGKLVHASEYFGEVTESKMTYLEGYVGARRMSPDGRSTNRPAGRQSEDQDNGEAVSETEASSPVPETATPSSSMDQVSPSSNGGAQREAQKEAENEQPVQVENTKKPQTQGTAQRVPQSRPVDAQKKAAPSRTAKTPSEPDKGKDQKSRTGEAK